MTVVMFFNYKTLAFAQVSTTWQPHWSIVNIEQLVHKANFLFLQDQRVRMVMPASAVASPKRWEQRIVCNGTANICQVRTRT